MRLPTFGGYDPYVFAVDDAEWLATGAALHVTEATRLRIGTALLNHIYPLPIVVLLTRSEDVALRALLKMRAANDLSLMEDTV